ncbi:MAG TPA: hypothetical protein VN889_04550 [Solirubrobacteraceae bacterium]|nr:hypothetical protein [Solirubrobacteraceae bacterium]
MSQHELDGPDETVIAAREEFDFSPLAQLEVASVPVISIELSGVTCVGPAERPLGPPLGQSCGRPRCRYRAHDLTLHESRHALLSSFAQTAASISAPLDFLFDGLTLDVYRVRSRGEIRCANLEHHPVRDQLRFSAERLAAQPIASPEWELVRRLRDQRRTRAIRLAGAPSAQRLIVHTDLAEDLQVERLGTLAEVLPIVPAGLGGDGLAATVARRLGRTSD